MSRSARYGTAALLLGTLALVANPQAAPAQTIDAVRKASVTWERRQGPERQVIDQVCLVPDLPTFLEALSTWDEGHYFPILIDDVDFTFKFLRAFRPARIVRFPKKAVPLNPDKVWDVAVASVGRAWTAGEALDAIVPRGDAVPKSLGPTAPGVVFSHPDSPTLAGAVALAAGRFQPLLRWDSPKHFGDVLSEADAQASALRLEQALVNQVPRYDQLGDDCDFITLAGDWPYRYDTKDGPNAFDDLIGRFPTTRSRWAYVGRLSGGQTAGVYQAMCSLFLEPRSALLFNKYSEKDRPWSDYAMTGAVERLGPMLPVTERAGKDAGLSGWHEVFGIKNRYGLVMINSHGESSRFHLTDGPAHVSDIPFSVPTIILMIHSFSAANPEDAATLAGRWLANGAYIYYGSMNEPYLEAFRTPKAVATLMTEHLPLSAVMRQTAAEARGYPWRLLYLGDPLYRIEPDRKTAPRLTEWPPAAAWEDYTLYEITAANPDDDLRLNYVSKNAVFRLREGVKLPPDVDLPATLLQLQREKLTTPLPDFYDSLLIETLIAAKRSSELLERLLKIPDAERSLQVRRAIETLQVAKLQKLVTRQDFPAASAYWGELAHAHASADLIPQITERVSALANNPARLGEWRAQLRAVRPIVKDTPGASVVEQELKQVEEKLKASKPR